MVNELRTEKVDVVEWREDPAQLIAEALAPAKVREVRIDEEARAAIVVVSDHQLSLAIGREGQNARLAARLTGYRVDIRSESEEAGGTVASRAESATPPVPEVATAKPVEERRRRRRSRWWSQRWRPRRLWWRPRRMSMEPAPETGPRACGGARLSRGRAGCDSGGGRRRCRGGRLCQQRGSGRGVTVGVLRGAPLHLMERANDRSR